MKNRTREAFLAGLIVGATLMLLAALVVFNVGNEHTYFELPEIAGMYPEQRSAAYYVETGVANTTFMLRQGDTVFVSETLRYSTEEFTTGWDGVILHYYSDVPFIVNGKAATLQTDDTYLLEIYWRSGRLRLQEWDTVEYVQGEGIVRLAFSTEGTQTPKYLAFFVNELEWHPYFELNGDN